MKCTYAQIYLGERYKIDRWRSFNLPVDVFAENFGWQH